MENYETNSALDQTSIALNDETKIFHPLLDNRLVHEYSYKTAKLDPDNPYSLFIHSFCFLYVDPYTMDDIAYAKASLWKVQQARDMGGNLTDLIYAGKSFQGSYALQAMYKGEKLKANTARVLGISRDEPFMDMLEIEIIHVPPKFRGDDLGHAVLADLIWQFMSTGDLVIVPLPSAPAPTQRRWQRYFSRAHFSLIPDAPFMALAMRNNPGMVP